ncbi:MAG: efflux RND transporter permease subunit, partial [Bryobacterales bacterium]|nr:efflux RND transporter permease subunit [Bryobacterales bacterium]
LELSYDEARRSGRLNTISELREAIVHGAVKRIRPKFMTVATDFIGRVPILWATGTGSDVMKRIAAPLIGGVFHLVPFGTPRLPVLYELWKRRQLAHAPSSAVAPAEDPQEPPAGAKPHRWFLRR